MSFWLGAMAACSPPNDEAPRAYADLVRADRPASYWRFGDVEGTAARDETGQAPGAISAGVKRGVEGALGDASSAFEFDGATGVVVAPDIYPFGDRLPFAVEVWIAPSPGGLPLQRICNHRVGPPHTGWRLVLNATKRALFERWSNEVSTTAMSAPLPTGVYSHVVARYDGRTLDLFVDGVLASSVPDEHVIGPFAAPLTWGAASTSTLDFFSGRLDEAAIYEHALGTDRVAAHFAARRAHEAR